MRVSKLLLQGKDNAIKGTRLVDLMELKDLRHLTQLVESERRAGSPICASNSAGSYGYYFGLATLNCTEKIRSC